MWGVGGGRMCVALVTRCELGGWNLARHVQRRVMEFPRATGSLVSTHPSYLGLGFEHVIHAPPYATSIFHRHPSESWVPGPFQKSRFGLCVVTIVSYDIRERRRLSQSGLARASQRLAWLE